AGRSDLAQHDCRLPLPFGGRHLSANPRGRRVSAAFHHRTGFSRRAARPDPSARRSRSVRVIGKRIDMDIFVLLATMLFCFVIGMPIAYSLAFAAIAGAWSIGIPLEAVMLKISDGVSKVAMLTIPFFVLAGAIMAEGGMARRLVAFADVLVGFTRVRGGLSVVNVLATTFLSGISGS